MLLIAVFFAAAVWGLNYFYNSGYFKVKSVDIQDNMHYEDKEIITLAQDLVGNNIFEVNKKKIEDTITEELNWIKEVELSKIFPDKVIIKLIERKPSLKIVYKSEYFLVDDEGVVLDKISEENLDSYKDLILVKNAVNYNVTIGEKIAKRNVLSCVEIYKVFDSELKSIIKEARLENNISGDIVFHTNDGKEIIFGDSSYIAEKVEILKQLLKEEADYTIIDSIDLRSPESPVIKYKEEAAEEEAEV